MESTVIQRIEDWSREDHRRSEVVRQYMAWREKLRQRINNQGELPLMRRPDKKREEMAINRQVALAILSDMEYNLRLNKDQVEEYTGKSQVYWNFLILGHTVMSEDEKRRVREEQKTTDYVLAVTLNTLKSKGVEIKWARLGFYLEQARFRVISEPAENRVPPKERHLRTESKRDIWRMQCGGECVEPGLEYPAPWHVANWAGDRVPGNDEMLILDWEGYKEVTMKPGRVKRLDIACFTKDNQTVQIPGEEHFSRRPRILDGLGSDELMKSDEDISGDLEKWMALTLRKMKPMMEQETRRRQIAEERVRFLEDKVQDLEEKLTQLSELKQSLKEVREENEIMRKWGTAMKKNMEQINKLSWLEGIGKKLNKD